jgi:hypothetical protein
MNYSLEELQELFGCDLLMHQEHDDDRYYDVEDNWLEFYIINSEIYFKSNKGWLKFIYLVKPLYKLKDGIRNLPICVDKDDDLRVNGFLIEDIKVYDKLPEELVEMILK